MQIDERKRLSIDVPADIYHELNELLSGWRVKNALFKKITEDLVSALRIMTPYQRKSFIIAIVESDIELNEWLSILEGE